MKYIIETKEPITKCMDCPFFKQHATIAHGVKCMHPEFPNEPRYIKAFTVSSMFSTAFGCPLKALRTHKLTTTHKTNMELMNDSTEDVINNLLTGNLARVISSEIPLSYTDELISGIRTYKKEITLIVRS